jgi:antitoxin component HigA of HigAB toxin-antitoxin module
MNQEKVKKAVELAEKELQEEEEQKQRDLIKRAIKQTLEKIKEEEQKRDEANKKIKTLKQDIDNIRAGRLDLIAERQEKDDEAKKTSIIEVIKEKEIHHHHYDRWYEPYRIIWKDEPLYLTTTAGSSWTYCDCSDIPLSNTCAYNVTNSIAKDSVAGTYQLDNGDCVTLT